MSRAKYIIIFLCTLYTSFFFTSDISGQVAKKEVNAVRIEDPPKIDGVLDESVWKNAPEAKDFFQYEPFNDRLHFQPLLSSSMIIMPFILAHICTIQIRTVSLLS